MKRIVCLLAVLVLCISLVCPVFAADFVPSIDIKDEPDIIPGLDENGKKWIGRILDATGKFIDYVYEDCLVLTPISQVITSPLIPDHAEEMMLKVYAALKDGSMKVPYEKFSDKLDESKMVIRELIDASWLCEDHPEILEPAGVHIEITFDLGIGKDTPIYVMTYKHDVWNPIVSTVNNGDGTVTCVFEDFCPILFAVPTGSDVPPAPTGDTANLTLWFTLLAVSAAALVAVIVFRRKAVR